LVGESRPLSSRFKGNPFGLFLRQASPPAWGTSRGFAKAYGGRKKGEIDGGDKMGYEKKGEAPSYRRGFSFKNQRNRGKGKKGFLNIRHWGRQYLTPQASIGLFWGGEVSKGREKSNPQKSPWLSQTGDRPDNFMQRLRAERKEGPFAILTRQSREQDARRWSGEIFKIFDAGNLRREKGGGATHH